MELFAPRPPEAVGDVRIECSGAYRGARCGALLFRWSPAAERLVEDTGVVRIRCRRCKAVNVIRLRDAASRTADLGPRVAAR